jgi:NAD(P)-dependent dehydrogenase (short-subunit alcohol dehydrogenase family)
MSVALITGGSAGLGQALAHALASDGWRVVVDGRHAERLESAADVPGIVAVPGDVADEWHRGALASAVEREGRLDLLVHNASTLGPTPMPRLADAAAADLLEVWRTNVAAPLALTADLLPSLRSSRGTLLSITSDAGAEHYEGWGLYGASKAALEHLTLTVGAEEPSIRAYAVDPGDMRTQMHQDAFPGEDISDRPLPESVVPHLLSLLVARPSSGRYRAADFPVAVQRVGA